MTSEIALVDGDSPCVFKRCRNPIYVEWLSREHRALRALAGVDLPVPRAVDYARIDTADGTSEAWLVMSRLPGRALWKEMIDADSERRAHLLRRVGQLLKRLHAAPVPAALQSESPWLDRILAEAEANLAWCDGSPELLADLRRRRPAPARESLIHGDFTLENVLLDEDERLSVIDWSGGAQGDPRCDVALALQTEPEFPLGEMELSAFFEGYGGVPFDWTSRRWFEDLYEFF
jgi:aminoglycoside phosphotransferase (APT) family kinase protein